MPISLDDLRGLRRRLETETLTRELLQLWPCGRVRADGARELADPHPFQRALEPRTAAVELERPAGELQPERRRLGVNAVRAAHDQCLPVLLGPGDDRGERAVQALQEQGAGLLHLERERRVEHVRGRQPVVEPAPSFVVEPLADGVHERGEVVPGLLLELADASRRRRHCLLPRRSRNVLGNDP